MRWATIKLFFSGLYNDIACNHTFAMAAALSYYFLLSLFPMLLFATAVLAFLPIPNLFDEAVKLVARFVPQQAMGVVNSIIRGVMHPPRSELLSLGFLGTIWAATGGFNAMIEALNLAYNVQETRPYYKTRSLSFLLTFTVGGLMLLGIGVTLLGPQFGELLANHRHAGPLFAASWPAVRWTIMLATAVFSVEVLYFLAPNVKQNFWATLPGAVMGVAGWIGVSLALGIYLRRTPTYNAMYGALGGVIALMLWFYFSSLTLLIGAEINAVIMRLRGRVLPMKAPEPQKQVELHAA